MKRNKMMRIAAVLLIVTLLSTCAISGTFAKYVSRAAANDSARVAKWGVTITTSSDLFSDTYATDDNSVKRIITSSVISEDGKSVVAPGTKGDGFKATITGKPEVATRFTLFVDLANIKDVVMPFGTYTDNKSGYAPDNTIDFTNPYAGTHADKFVGYAPVKWNLTVKRVKDDGTYGRTLNMVDVITDAVNAPGSPLAAYADLLPMIQDGASLTDVQTVASVIAGDEAKIALLNQIIDQYYSNTGAKNVQVIPVTGATANEILGFEISLDFEPGSNLNYEISADWHWDFETGEMTAAGIYEGDLLDTYLGNAAAGIVEKSNGLSTDLQFAVTATAVQID